MNVEGLTNEISFYEKWPRAYSFPTIMKSRLAVTPNLQKSVIDAMPLCDVVVTESYVSDVKKTRNCCRYFLSQKVRKNVQ